MSVSSGSDITIPIQDSPPPPPSPYAGTNGGSKGNDASTDNKSTGGGVGGTVTIIDTSAGGDHATGGKTTPEPRGDVTVTVGFVNEAYQDHSPDHLNRHSEKNGHSKMTNGQKKNSNGAISISVPGEGNEKGQHQEIHLNEAVNPELINMNILNTIPDKPNPEYGPYDNMDEYFVPVNQHKKFLRRSEKLYVTKDKRKESHWKKYVCWLLGATILAAIVTVAVLAGIGFIPQKSPNHFDSVVGTTSATESTAPSDDLSVEDAIISSSPGSLVPSSTEINTPPSVPDDATYVPMAADIQFYITDLSYEPALNDKTTERFQQLANEVQDEIKDILRSRAGLRTVHSRVTEFAPGSVLVKMRIGWLDQAMNFTRVTMMLSNVTTVGQYDIMPMSSYEVINRCKFNKNGCSHNCSYNYMELEFFCSCGDDETLQLAEDAKTCRSIYDITSSTSTTTSEVPLLPEFSSYSPSSVSEEESSPLPPVSSEDTVHDAQDTHTQSPDQEQEEEVVPTSQPEEEHETHHHQPASAEPSLSTEISHEEHELETSTDADIPSETLEPVSQEHHHEEAEMIPIVTTPAVTSTSTTTELPVEPVSEEVIQAEEHHEHEHQPAIIPVETTTPSATSTSTTHTPEPLVISSSEGTHSVEEESTARSSVPISSVETQSHEAQTESLGSTEHPQSESHSEELGRTDLDEVVPPTEQVPPVIPELAENSNSSENATLVEAVRDLPSEQEEEEQVQNVVPTEVSNLQSEQIGETTVSPSAEIIHEEGPASMEKTETVGHDDVQTAVDEEATTNVSEGDKDEDKTATTALPDVEEPAEEQNESHDITPIDVLSISSTKESTSTTPTTPVATHTSGEQSQGRSVASSIETSDEVERVDEGAGASDEASLRSQNLTQDENESATESNNRGARVLSTEIRDNHNMQLLTDDQEKSDEREPEVVPVLASQEEQEIPRSSQNVTETASVETADENPEMASAVTKTSSEDSNEGASRESTGSVSEDSQSGSNENNVSQGSIFDSLSSSRESSELSQEPPAISQSDSGESTTFTPLSLHHDIDINYLGNNTEDHVNSEAVQPHSEVESVEDDHVANHEIEKTSDKLVIAPEDEQVEITTTAPVENEEVASQSQEQTPELPASGERSESEEKPLATPVSRESSETQDETSGNTNRAISAFAEGAGSDESSESPNRDHRDTNADIETPGASKTSASEEEVITTEVPLAISSSTTSAPAETSTTTATTTTAAPVPEITLSDLTTTITSTTSAPIANNNDTKSSSVSNESGSDSVSQESSISGSVEGSQNSPLHSQEVSSLSSPEEETSVSEPSASSEARPFPSDDSLSDSHDRSDDHEQNELT